MTNIATTENYKINSFANGAYLTIENTNSGEDTLLQDEDASIFNEEYRSVIDSTSNVRETDRKIDILCSQYL